MKKLFLLALLAMLFVSCSDDDEENKIDKNKITGVWRVYEVETSDGVFRYPLSSGIPELTFHYNGNLCDEFNRSFRADTYSLSGKKIYCYKENEAVYFYEIANISASKLVLISSFNKKPCRVTFIKMRHGISLMLNGGAFLHDGEDCQYLYVFDYSTYELYKKDKKSSDDIFSIVEVGYFSVEDNGELYLRSGNSIEGKNEIIQVINDDEIIISGLKYIRYNR